VNLNDGAWATNALDTSLANGIRLYVHDKKNNEDYLAYFDNVRVFYAGGSVNPYETWVVAHGGEAIIGAMTNDYDGDGEVNLMEYALGGNPTSAFDVGEKPALLNAGGTWVYIHPQRSDDDSLIYTVETTTNLVSGTWTNAGYSVLGTNQTGATLDYVINAVPVENAQMYIRLKVIR
jgi:hypothetical protein